MNGRVACGYNAGTPDATPRRNGVTGEGPAASECGDASQAEAEQCERAGLATALAGSASCADLLAVSVDETNFNAYSP